MKQRGAVIGLTIASVVLLCLLVGFAIELSSLQNSSKRGVETRMEERARLAGALIDSLLGTVEQDANHNAKVFGAARVSARTMDAQRRTSDYLALLDADGAVLAESRGLTSPARSELSASPAVSLVRAGRLYGLGDLERYGRGRVIDLAVGFPTSHGRRILVTGVPSQAFGQFIHSDLGEIPGVAGSHSFVIDGRDTVIASTNPGKPAGYVFRVAAQKAIARGAGDGHGRYYVVVRLANSGWRIILTAPNGPFFASVEGLHKWLPWAILAAFALVTLFALGLRVRLVRITREVQQSNDRLELLNEELNSANDVLERRQQELMRSNDELEQFASIASHDLQEPLRKVRTFTQRISETDAEVLSERGADYLLRANAAAERMQQLIEDLLKFSRLATHGRPFVPVDLNAVVDDVLSDLEAQAEAASATVEVDDLPTIWGDPVQLRQLLQNLFSNALKFRREGVPAEISVRANDLGDTIEIIVADNGIGFEDQYSRRIFRVFERLHGRTEFAGTGIGLALCGKIVDRHGGTIRAHGVPGEGAIFTILLPTRLTEEAISLSPTAWRRQDAETEERYASV